MKKYIIEITVSLFIALSLILFFASQTSPAKQTAPLDKQYVETMRSYNNEYLNNISNDALIGVAKDICSDLMYGYTLDEVISLRLENNTEETRLVFGYVLMNGTKYFCPDYQHTVEELTW